MAKGSTRLIPRFLGWTTLTTLAAIVLPCALAQATPPATARVLAEGLVEPLDLTHAPGDAAHLFVLERAGRVRVIDLATGLVLATPYLDFSAKVCCADVDGGAQGIAFAPDYQTTGLVYVVYTAKPDGSSTVERYHVSAGDPLRADLASAHPIFHYARPIFGHDGGWVAFHPFNGFLYLSSGDGGEAFNPDPTNAAQRIVNEKKGKLLRIDPTGDDFPADATQNYRVPTANPFVGTTGDDEIFAFGLRNPWRCAFDQLNGDLYIADVGQDTWEEIDFEFGNSNGGRNYGWRCTEGTACTGLSGCVCNEATLTPPIFQYGHDLGCSITGGVVYRGAAIPSYTGRYFYGDFCSGRVWSIKVVAGVATDHREHTADWRASGSPEIGFIVCFGTDAGGAMYVADHIAGRVFKVVPRCPSDFDNDGFVTGDDFDGYVSEFVLGNAAADFDEDGFVTGDDFDAYAQTFVGGC